MLNEQNLKLNFCFANLCLQYIDVEIIHNVNTKFNINQSVFNIIVYIHGVGLTSLIKIQVKIAIFDTKIIL